MHKLTLKEAWQVLKRLAELLHDPETPLLYRHPKEVKQVCAKKSTFSTCRKMFIAALFVRTKKWK